MGPPVGFADWDGRGGDDGRQGLEGPWGSRGQDLVLLYSRQ